MHARAAVEVLVGRAAAGYDTVASIRSGRLGVQSQSQSPYVQWPPVQTYQST